MSNLKAWSVTLKDGTEINVPGKAKTRYELISQYGHQAIIERVTRTRAYKKAIEEDDSNTIRSITTPKGETITQL